MAILIIVMVLPVVTFLRNRTLQGGPPSERTVEYGEVRAGGAVYSVEPGPLFPANDEGIELFELEPGVFSSNLKVIAPSPDGTLTWVVEGSTIRVFDDAGRRVSEFETPPRSALHVPGYNRDLWIDATAGVDGTEELIHLDINGKELDRISLPEGLFARSVQPAPDGSVWALSEEWVIDSEQKVAMYQGTLLPIVAADGSAVADPAAGAKPGTFIGADGRIYSLSGQGGIQLEEYPAFTVTARDAEGTVQQYRFPKGVRPYAADASGRVYAEPIAPAGVEGAPGVSTLGDVAEENVDVLVFDADGLSARLPFQRHQGFNIWAPAAWPTSDGELVASVWGDDGLRVITCAPQDSVKPVSASGEPGPADARVLMPFDPPTSGDPYMSRDQGERDLWQAVYSPLVSFDASLNPVPELAASVPAPGDGVSKDGLTIEWKIVAGKKWHDGKPVTANDVVETWKHLKQRRTVHPPEPFPGFDLITVVSAEGDTVRVKLSKPFGPAPEAFFPFVLPAHVVSDSAAQANGGLAYAPVGSGPYRLSRWEDRRWMLEAVEGGQDSPLIARLDVEFVAHDEAKADYMSSPIPTLWTWIKDTDRTEIERDAVGEVSTSATGRWWGLLLNSENPLLASAELRSAFLMTYPASTALELYGVSADTTQGAEPFAGVMVPPDVDLAVGDQGVKPGTRILRDAGWRDTDGDKFRDKDGVTAEPVYTQTFRNGAHEVLAEIGDELIPTWKEMGTKSSWAYGQKYFYGPVYQDGKLSRGDYFMATGVFPGFEDPAWGSVFDPADTPSWSNHRGMSVTRTQDPELRRLHQAARTSGDPQERTKAAEQIIARVRELNLAFFERPEIRTAASLGVEGYEPGAYPAGDFWNVEAWQVAK